MISRKFTLKKESISSLHLNVAVKRINDRYKIAKTSTMYTTYKIRLKNCLCAAYNTYNQTCMFVGSISMPTYLFVFPSGRLIVIGSFQNNVLINRLDRCELIIRQTGNINTTALLRIVSNSHLSNLKLLIDNCVVSFMHPGYPFCNIFSEELNSLLT